MTIYISIKSVYGRETIYPACSASNAFAALAGTKTLTRQALKIIKTLGYTVEVEQVKL